jgi:LPS-assembly protein
VETLAAVTRNALLPIGALAVVLATAHPAGAQDLQDRAVTPPPPLAEAPSANGDDPLQFSADTLE